MKAFKFILVFLFLFGFNLSILIGCNKSSAKRAVVTPPSPPDDPNNAQLAITDAGSILSDNHQNYSVGGTCSEKEETLSVQVGSLSAVDTDCTNWTWLVENIDTGTVPNGPVTITVSQTSNSPLTESVDVKKCLGSGTLSGEGTAASPKWICNYEELKDIADDLTKYYVLGVDIDARASWSEGSTGCGAYDGRNVAAANPCAGWVPLELTGSFNGQDHTISNLYIYVAANASTNNVGLFSVVNSLQDRLYIQNLHLKDAYVQNEKVSVFPRTNTGGLVGNLQSEDDNGNTGANNELSMDNCSVQGTIKGKATVGGLVGIAQYEVIISNSYADVNVTGFYVGGLVGYLDDEAVIYNSHSRGEVTGDNFGSTPQDGQSYAGGLVGISGESNSGDVKNSYSHANVSGENAAGSLLGQQGDGTEIYNSYGKGQVNGTGNQLGGLVGNIFYGGNTSDNFWDTETTGRTNSFSSPADDDTVSLTAEGLTTVQMQSSCTGSNANDSICSLGGAFVFTENEYPKVKKCTNCKSATPTFSSDLVGGQL